MGRRIVIVGGVAAGASAAAKARRVDPSASITVFERSPYVSFAACGLPYSIADHRLPLDKLVVRSAEAFEKSGIRVRTRHDVLGIRTESRHLEVQDLETGDRFREPFDVLLLATGASPIRPRLPGDDLDGIHALRTIPDGEAIEATLQRTNTDVAVIGGGYIGLEMVETLRHRERRVTLVEMADRILAGVGPEIAARVEGELRSNGVEVMTNARLQGYEGEGAVQRVRTSAGTFRSDMVLLAMGVRPNSRLAREAGVEVDDRGAIVVDDHLRTNIDGIYAAGDVAQTLHRVTGKMDYLPLATNANKQGKTAGINMAGGDARFDGAVGTAITRAFRLSVARTGLTTEAADRAGIPARSVIIEAPDRAHYMPEHAPLTVEIVFRPDDGRLLGGALLGEGLAVKRVDVLASVLHFGGSVRDLARLDLAYAPPFSTVWDPILVAAQAAASKL